MKTVSGEKVVCEECDWRGFTADLLQAPNPFDPSEQLSGCPRCKAPESTLVACDADGCWQETSCGTPTADGGYTRTCNKHFPRWGRERYTLGTAP